MKLMGDVDARVHLFLATTLGGGRLASPTLGRLYPDKAQVLTLQEAERASEPFRTRRSEEKSPHFHCPELNTNRSVP